jgi:putative ABC transport system permease protein
VSRVALVRRSLGHYARTNAAVVAGVAIAASVLIGALVVGDSLRATLRELALARLGRTDRVLTAQRFVAEGLAADLAKGTGRPTAPLVVLSGAVGHEQSGRRASNVKVYGVDERFWAFHGQAPPAAEDRQAALSEALAAELAADPASTLLVRLEQPSDIPAASLFGRREDRGRTLRVARGPVLPRAALGEFSLDSGQQAVRALFVPLRLLQRTLAQPSRVNTILMAEGPSDPWPATREALTLEHLGLRLRPLSLVPPYAGDLGPLEVLSLESASGFVSDEIARAAASAAAQTGMSPEPVLTYLVNEMRVGERTVPYSLVSALAPPALERVAGSDVGAQGVVLNEWAALELGARPGDRVSFSYFVWEEEGRLATREASLPVEAIVPLTGFAADRDYAPEYPGITDSAHLSDWDPPFPLDLSRVRPQDEAYWEKHRATPKAFLALEAGRALWRHRLGAATSIRIVPDGRPIQQAQAAFTQSLLPRLDPAQAGLALLPVRDQALAAAQGAGDFGQYFLAFSVFLIAAALLLAGLVFRLGVEQRAREIGLLRAVGWPEARVRGLLLREGVVLAALGALLGTLGAMAYAWLVLLGLRTVWVDAVGLTQMRLALTPTALLAGAIAAVLAGLLSVRLALRALRRTSPRLLLAGGSGAHAPAAGRTRALWIVAAGLVLAAGLSFGAVRGAVPPAGGFFGAGFGLLAASLAALWHRLTRGATAQPLGSETALGLRNATWRPGRSLLVAALIAFGTFVVVAVGAFRKDAQAATADRHTGHGGYALVGESALPVLFDPGTAEGREALGLAEDAGALSGVGFTRLRLLPGDEASCLNLYRPQRPRVLGAPESFLREGRFVFADSLAATEAERANPWLLLAREPEDGAIPAIADANSLAYVLHQRLGDVLEIDRGGSPPLRLRFVGALRDSLFQGELVVSERRFLDAFPDDPGYRFLLLDAPFERATAISGVLESRLDRLGLDLTSAPERLDRFHRVENAYLSTFQTLGALGLLLGTVGLAAVLLRNALERRRELALLRAVGYRRRDLTLLVLAEHGAIVAAGLAAGTASALLAIVPAALARGASLPVSSLAALVGAVLAAALVASLAAAALLHRQPLLAALRSE